MAFTWDETRQFIRDLNDDNSDAKSQRLERNVANSFLSWMSGKFRWHHYQEQLIIPSVEEFASGTVTVTNGTALVTVSSGVSLPSTVSAIDNSGLVGRRIKVAANDYWFEITSANTASGQFFLETAWPFSTASGQSYNILRDKYWLPADFRAGGDLYSPTMLLRKWSLAGYQTNLNLNLQGEGQTWRAVFGKDGPRDRFVLYVDEPPSELEVWAGWYYQRPVEITGSTTSATALNFPEEYRFLFFAGLEYFLAERQRRDNRKDLRAEMMQALWDAQAADKLYRGEQEMFQVALSQVPLRFIRTADEPQV